MKCFSRTIKILIMLFAIDMQIAIAEPYIIKVKQAEKDEWEYSTECEHKPYATCDLYMGFKPDAIYDEEDMDLRVNALIKENKINFRFNRGLQYFAVSNLDHTVSFDLNDAPLTENVKLYLRSRAVQDDGQGLAVKRPSPIAIAELEINVTHKAKHKESE